MTRSSPPWPTPKPRWARSTSWSTTRASRPRSAYRMCGPRTTTSSSTPMSGAPSSWRKRWASACWPVPAVPAPAGFPAGGAPHNPPPGGAAGGSLRGGRMINIAWMAGLKVLPQIGAYCMSKAAVVQMTRAMAGEWGRFGINVNAICPGYIDTEINHHHWQTEQGRKLVAMLPRKRVGSPEDLDALLVMLASDQSHFINGAVIAADDGFAV